MKRLHTLPVALAIAFFSLSAPFASASTTSSVILPNSDGNYLQFQPKTNGAAHYTMVNESLCNGTSNYNTATTVGLRDSYGTSIASIGNGALISQVGVVPCASLNTSGSATGSVFYRWNGADSTDKGNYKLTGTTPVQLTPTSTWPGLSLFKTSTSILEIGAALSAETGTNGMRLSRIATVLTYSLTVPTAPSSLAATDISSSQINLAWNDNSNNELGFKIYRKLNNGSFSQVATTVSWNTTSTDSYSDTGLTADQTYSYEVIAYNSAGTSTSNISTAITYSTVPTAPSNLTAVTSSNNVVLTWADNSANEDGFKIERSTDNITYTQIATTTMNLGSSTTSYTDVAAAGTPYYYRVRAYNTIGNSAYTGAVEGIYTVIVSGIYSDTTWTPGNIYRLDNSLSVTTAKLTIQAGTIVKLGAGKGLSVTSSGVLSVQGTSSGNVYFTSLKDDSLGGDTNGDTTSTAPAPGDWDSIQLYYGASSTVSFATVTYGGNNGNSASLYNNGGILTIGNSTVAHSSNVCVYTLSGITAVLNSDLATYQSSGGYGVYVVGGTVTVSANTIHDNENAIYGSGAANLTFTNNTFTNNVSAVYLILSSGLTFTNSGNTATGTGKHRIALVQSPTVNETWSSDTIAYDIPNGITVPSGVTLTINPGAVVKFGDSNSAFNTIYLEIAGTLVARGNASSKIYFTSIRDDSTEALGDSHDDTSTPAAGDWDTVKFDANASSSISYAILRYGGYGASGYEGLLTNSGGTVAVDNTEMATSAFAGIKQSSGTSTVITSNIHNANTYDNTGVYLTGGASSVTRNSIHDNYYGIHGTGGVLTYADNTYANNTVDTSIAGVTGPITKSGTLITDETWSATTYPYIIESFGLTVTSGVTLTINPGVVVKLSATLSKLTVLGTLKAEGTSGNKIYFTSLEDDSVDGDTTLDGNSSGAAGNWGTVKVEVGASSTISYAFIKYGGNDGELYNNGGILNLSADEVATSSNAGIYLASGTTTISASDIHHNLYGIWVNGGSASIAENAIRNNSLYGLYNGSGSAVTAQHNFWGSWAPPSWCDDESPACSNSASGTAAVDFTLRHHVQGYWAAQHSTLLYYLNTSYSSFVDAAANAWNSTASSVGIISVSSTLDSSSANLVVSDYAPGFLSNTSIGTTVVTDVGGIHATTHFYPDNMQKLITDHGSSAPDYEQNTATHEMGHSLGLGHSNPTTGDIMYTPVNSQTSFGPEDKNDYNFLWNTMSWATSRWWVY